MTKVRIAVITSLIQDTAMKYGMVFCMEVPIRVTKIVLNFLKLL